MKERSLFIIHKNVLRNVSHLIFDHIKRNIKQEEQMLKQSIFTALVVNSVSTFFAEQTKAKL